MISCVVTYSFRHETDPEIFLYILLPHPLSDEWILIWILYRHKMCSISSASVTINITPCTLRTKCTRKHGYRCDTYKFQNRTLAILLACGNSKNLKGSVGSLGKTMWKLCIKHIVILHVVETQSIYNTANSNPDDWKCLLSQIPEHAMLPVQPMFSIIWKLSLLYTGIFHTQFDKTRYLLPISVGFVIEIPPDSG